MELTDPLILTWIAFAIGLGFFTQTISGFGAGLIALPMMAMVIDLPDALSLASIYFFLFSLYFVAKEYPSIQKKIVAKLGLGIIIGLFLGVQLLKVGDPTLLKKALGAVVLIYVVYQIKAPQIKIRTKETNPLVPLLTGTLSGFFSGTFASGGPVIVMYLNNFIQDKHLFRATLIGVLAITNLIRVPILMGNGLMNLTHLTTGLIVFPAFILAIILGKITYRVIPQNTFRKFILIILFIQGFVLIF